MGTFNSISTVEEHWNKRVELPVDNEPKFLWFPLAGTPAVQQAETSVEKRTKVFSESTT